MSRYSLEDKVILVTGGTGDLGAAIANLLISEGAKVAITGRSKDGIDEVLAGFGDAPGSVIGIEVDLGTEAAAFELVAAVERDLGPIYGAVNTVGPMIRSEKSHMYSDDELWQFHFDQVLMPTVRVCREVMPLLKERRRGSIVNVAATSARFYAGYLGAYGAMKGAVAHVTKNYARDGAEYGIRVNCIHPGWIALDKTKDMVARTSEEQGVPPEQVIRDLIKVKSDNQFHAMRMGEPSEYAHVIAFLLSDYASYVNSAWLAVDGGSPTS